ncbi:MAG: hypothetical protein FWH18_06630 [Marinilabiliaceae bacterium]|nr:hypothetical protein [Marinilabiliaceae bacterium]
MINIERSPEAPKYLNTQEIKDYVDRAIQFKNDRENFPIPKKPTSYRDNDLLKAFDRDFFSKCYLTEEKFPNSWIMDVDHFIPQSERPDLVYEWSNLFPAQHHANMMKPRKTPDGGYLNPCDPNDDVENEIIYSLSVRGFNPTFTARNHNNIKAKNTCSLLDRIHNGHNYDTQKLTETLRHTISKKYDIILKKINEYKGTPENSQERIQVLRELRDHLSRKSSFTMLCRSMPAVSLIKEELFD